MSYINEKICFVCNKELKRYGGETFIYQHFHCEKHFKIMNDNGKNVMYRLIMGDNAIECWANDHKKSLELHLNGVYVDIPYFDIFEFTFAEIKEKIKTYVLFS